MEKIRNFLSITIGAFLFTTISASLVAPTSAVEPSNSAVDLEVDIIPVLNLSVSQPEAIVFNASTINTFQSVDIVADVTTNNITGYTLTMSSDSTNLTNDDVVKEGVNPVVPTLQSNATPTNFALNHWGISYDDGVNYVPFTLSYQFEPITEPVNHSYTTLKAGAKLDYTLDAGTYINTVTFVAVANPTSFTVTWNANGGTVSPTTSVYGYNEPLGQYPVARRSGYSMTGWFLTPEDGGSAISRDTPVTADVTYYAHWRRNSGG